jgi:hypothetical protein
MNGVQHIARDEAALLRIDERNHVEKPFLDQLHGLGWKTIDLDSTQQEKVESIR